MSVLSTFLVSASRKSEPSIKGSDERPSLESRTTEEQKMICELQQQVSSPTDMRIGKGKLGWGKREPMTSNEDSTIAGVKKEMCRPGQIAPQWSFPPQTWLLAAAAAAGRSLLTEGGKGRFEAEVRCGCHLAINIGGLDF